MLPISLQLVLGRGSSKTSSIQRIRGNQTLPCPVIPVTTLECPANMLKLLVAAWRRVPRKNKDFWPLLPHQKNCSNGIPRQISLSASNGSERMACVCFSFCGSSFHNARRHPVSSLTPLNPRRNLLAGLLGFHGRFQVSSFLPPPENLLGMVPGYWGQAVASQGTSFQATHHDLFCKVTPCQAGGKEKTVNMTPDFGLQTGSMGWLSHPDQLSGEGSAGA